jgi:hypothetical protein
MPEVFFGWLLRLPTAHFAMCLAAVLIEHPETFEKTEKQLPKQPHVFRPGFAQHDRLRERRSENSCLLRFACKPALPSRSQRGRVAYPPN